MSPRVSFSLEARQELLEAADYYDSENPGLGASFLDSVENALKRVTAFPESAPIARGSSRIIQVPRFPYSLIYSLRPGEIRILAVMNQKRRPFYWWGKK